MTTEDDRRSGEAPRESAAEGGASIRLVENLHYQTLRKMAGRALDGKHYVLVRCQLRATDAAVEWAIAEIERADRATPTPSAAPTDAEIARAYCSLLPSEVGAVPIEKTMALARTFAAQREHAAEATRTTTAGSHHPVSTSVVGQIRADQRSAGGPLVVMHSPEASIDASPNASVALVRCFACASQQPEAACSHWVGISWSCTDRKACRERRIGGLPPGWLGHNEPDDHGAEDLPPAKPWDACDHYPSDLTKAACSCWRGAPAKVVDKSPPWGCVHGYTMPHADTLCPHCCPLAWRAKSSPGAHVGPLGNDVTCEWIDRHVARLETSVKEATDESERLREEWAEARSGPKCSRGEYVAALEAMEFSTRTATIEECARWLEESEDLDLVAGRMRKEMREAKP